MKTLQKNELKYLGNIIVLCVVLCTLLSMTVSFASSIEVKLEPSTIPLNSSASLHVTVEGSNNVQIDIPKVDGLIFQHTLASQQSFNNNGNVIASVANIWQIYGERIGKYTIPSFTVVIDGKKQQTSPLEIEITTSSSGGGGFGNIKPQKNLQNSQQPDETKEALQENDIAFLEIETADTAYLGESVPIVIKAYLNANVRLASNSITPPVLSGEGINMNSVGVSPHQYQEEKNGRLWNVLMWETTLSGIKVGKHDAEFFMNATALIPSNHQPKIVDPFDSLNNIFNDPFFNSAFTHYTRKPLKIDKKISFNTLELPAEGRPDNFNGAIGDFDIRTTTANDNVTIGEPFVLVTTIQGAGNFERITSPALPDNDSFRTYPPKSEFEAMGKRGAGEKRFEQAVIVQDKNVTEIPALRFSYFDPQRKEYITKESTAIPLKSSGETLSEENPQQSLSLEDKKSKNNEKKETPNKQEKPRDSKGESIQEKHIDTLPQKVEFGTMQTHVQPLPQRLWFLLVCGILLIGNIVLLGIWIYQKGSRAERRAKEKAANIRLAGDLKTVQAAMDNGDGHLFLAGSRVAIQNRLARRCKMHPSSISLGDLERILDENSPLLSIFKLTDTVRYGGEFPEGVETNVLYTQLKEELEAVR